MAKLSKFDHAIKEKVKGLEGEPSAKVWAGIRAATPVRKPRAAWYRAGFVLIVLLGITATGYYLYDPAQPKTTTEAVSTDRVNPELTKSESAATLPEEPAAIASAQAEEKNEESTSFAPNTSNPVLKRPDHTYTMLRKAQKPQPNFTTGEAKKKNSTPEIDNIEPETDLVIVPITDEVFVTDDIETIEESEPVELPDAEIASGQQAEPRTSGKRQINLTDMGAVRQKANGVLESAARRTSEAINLEVETRQVDSTHQQKEVSAKILGIRFKRVKKTRN